MELRANEPSRITARGIDYFELFDLSPIAAWVRDFVTMEFIAVNRAAVERYGYSPAEFLLMRVADIEIESGRHVTKDGIEVPVRVHSAKVVVENAAYCLELIEDVTNDDDAQIGELEELANLGTWRWDVAENHITWSPQLARIFGLAQDALPSTFPEYLAHVHPADRAATLATVHNALVSHDPFDGLFRIIRPDGETRWLRSRGRVIADPRSPVRMIGACQDVTEQKVAEAALTTLALHDSLTGLPERTLFVDRANQAIKRISRKSEALAVMFMDLDRFKLVNDTFGHAAGDDVLAVVASRLQAVLRPGDTVARVGGDEFAILCEEVTADAAVDLARRVVDAVAQPVPVNGRVATTGVSVGVTLSSDSGTSADALLRDADLALYAAKQAGRNRFVVFDDEARVRDFERMRRTDELHAAVDAGELRVHYQPEIDLATNAIVGVEALVRWDHPTLGLLGPGEFIRLAEETRLVVSLGAWVLEQACTEVAGWPIDAKRSLPLVSVNISAPQLSEPTFVNAVRRVLARTALEPAQLCLEITESVLMEEAEAATVALGELRTIGVRLAIDDFGTGYSSLSYLRRFPVDIVKIDRSFIAAVGLDSAADAIVAAVVNLSHALGFLVVAEGVESDDQLAAIRALGCDRAQGHYWSPALPPEDLGDWSRAALQLAAVEPVHLHAALVERIEALRAATGRNVMTEVPSKLGSVVADPRSLKALFDHLLGNAVAYSSEDRPVVVTAASDRHWVRVSIADFGIGMTAEESARCFEQFWQAGTSSLNRPRGTGIGLYIVRSIVEAVGGHIAVKSAKGRGSTFTVALPRSSRSAPAQRRRTGRTHDVGEDSSIREFMRQLGVPTRRGA